MQLTTVVLAVSRALSWMCQETAISGYSYEAVPADPRARSTSGVGLRTCGCAALMLRMRAVQARRESLLSRFLLPQGNSVDDRRKRLFTEREIQMLFRHRQRELRSPLQPLREI